MTYAIIETGGKQLRVEPGRFYDIELLSTPEDETVTIESVLLVQHNGEVTIGQPLVEGAKVEGTVMRHLRGRKVLVYKMKPKKKTRKKRGHRQEITRLMINSISLNGSVFTLEETAAETESNIISTEADHPSAETAAETESNIISPEADHPSAETATETESNIISPEADHPSTETAAETESNITSPEADHPSAETAAETESNITSLEADHPSAETAAETESNITSPEADNPSAETDAETESNITSPEADNPSAETDAES